MNPNFNKNFELFLKKLTNLKLLFQKKLSFLPVPEYVLFSIYAIFTGAIVGLAAVLFHESIILVTEISFDHIPEYLYFVVPAIGMLILSFMTYLAPDTAKRKGVSEVIKAVALRGGYIPFRTTFFHFIAPVLCIGTGNTVGPEGPVAQLGGGISSKIGSILGLSDARRRVFTAAGAGAVISAVFNSPLGGIFFALEIVLLNDFQSPTFSALVLASVTASAISRIFLGNTPTFIFDEISIGTYNHLYIYAILGLAAGLASLLFIRYSDTVERIFKEKILKKYPRWIPMVIIGLVMGTAGYFYKGIFGIGYEAINNILAGSELWDTVLILLLLKFILVPLILYSGGFGGLFAPSLFIGAGVGFLFAFGINYLFGINLDTTAYVLVGMGAVLGGVNSIPISAILIIFEMTKNYTFILPLMLAVIISTTIVQVILKGSIHIKHLEREGYKISSGRETNILRSIFVEDVMRDDVFLVMEKTSIGKLINKLLEQPHATFYTVNDKGELVGTISENEIRPIITEYQHIRETLIASDIAKPGVTTVLKSDDLDYTLKLFGSSNVDQLPVVLRNAPLKAIGTVWRDDVINAYNKESFKHNLTDELAEDLKRIEKTSLSKVSDGYSIVEKQAIPKFVGKTLVQLRIRNNYGLEVLMIKQNKGMFDYSVTESEIIMPDPNYVIQSDDILVLFGSDEKIEQIKNW
ncbi:MAG: chloride channel protein [Ignavibacteriales bacterium]|nr:chloride channel protein [Ignavibacteriales bacterium]